MKVVRVRKYKDVRMPMDVYLKAKQVQEKLQRVAKEITGKTTRIPLTRVYRVKMSTPTTITDSTLKKIIKKKR